MLGFLDAGQYIAAGGEGMGQRAFGGACKGKAFPAVHTLLLRMRRTMMTIMAREMPRVM